jgi:sugar fermentation stimulation protein A
LKIVPGLQRATLLRRYKRFLADLETPDGHRMTVHCPNTGAMRGCDTPGAEAWYSDSANPKRKYRHTLEVVVTPSGRVGVNTARANALIREALELGSLEPFSGLQILKAEAAIPDEPGRFDFLLENPDEPTGLCYVEVKNMTLCDEAGRGSFPDAVSERAVKHVRALMRRVAAGERSALVFCVQHTGITKATLADEIHSGYGEVVREAVAAGVEVHAFACQIEPDEIRVAGPIPFDGTDQRVAELNVFSV